MRLGGEGVIKKSLAGVCSAPSANENLDQRLEEKAHVILQILGSLQSITKEKVGKQRLPPGVHKQEIW